MQRRSPTTRNARSSRSSAGDDAVSMLMEDHKKVQKLFRDFEKAHDKEDDDSCREIAQLVCTELEVHTTLEEELFYPAAREILGEDEELIDEAEVEHQSAKELVAQLRGMDPSDAKFAPTFTVLAEYVKHHIKEEEGQIFPKVQKARLDVDGLGQEMQARKSELNAEAEVGEPPEREDEDRSRSRARVAG